MVPLSKSTAPPSPLNQKMTQPPSPAAHSSAAASSSIVEVDLTTDDEIAVLNAKKKQKRKAKAAAKKLMEEAANMKKRIAHEKQVMQASAPGYSPLTESTPPERKPFIDVCKPALRIGEYVSVRNDPVPGQVSGWGGQGFVLGVRGTGAATKVDVLLDEMGGGRLIKDVDIRMVTKKTFMLSPGREKRRRTSVEVFDPTPTKKSTKEEQTFKNIGERLQAGFSSSKGKGWRRLELGLQNSKRLNNDEWAEYEKDRIELTSIISTRKQYGDHVELKRDVNKIGRFRKRKVSANPLSLLYLNRAWGESVSTVEKTQ